MPGNDRNHQAVPLPIASMYGIFAYIYHKNQLNVGKYTIHGSYGLWSKKNPTKGLKKPMDFVVVESWSRGS